VPALAPTFDSTSAALRARAVAYRTRDELWENIRLLTEADVRPSDYQAKLDDMNARLLSAQHDLTVADRWLAIQPAAA
jgi:hypothetical protein